jgi:hypothetical protein
MITSNPLEASEPMYPFCVIALLLMGCHAVAQDDARLLQAIGQVEGGVRTQRGDGGKAYGLYQTHREAWQEGNQQLAREGRQTYSLLQWRSPVAQDMVALALLRVIRGRLASEGIHTPTPQQLALIWGMGFTGAKAVGFDHRKAPTAKADYAQRVANLACR